MYSVDTDVDSLVLIDTSDGAVYPQAYLGADMFDTDLAVLGGTVYVLNLYPLPAPSAFAVDLIAVSRQSHEVLSSVPVTLDGVPVSYAEALAVHDGKLIAAFNTNPGCATSCSNALGELSAGGVLSNVVGYEGIDALADADGLAAWPDGHLLWWDADPTLNRGRLIDTTFPAATYGVICTQTPYRATNDIAFDDEGALWGVDNGTMSLVRIDLTTCAVVGTNPYGSSHALRGLAPASPLLPTGSGLVQGTVAVSLVLLGAAVLSRRFRAPSAA